MALADTYGGSADEYKFMVADDDWGGAVRVAGMIAGDDEEAMKYIAWLRQRTLALIAAPGFTDAVEALGSALLTKKTLTGVEARKIIRETRSSAVTRRARQNTRR